MPTSHLRPRDPLSHEILIRLRSHRGTPLVLLLGIAMAIPGCRDRPTVPTGKAIRGDAAAARAWLSSVSELRGTRAAEAATRALRDLEGCERFSASCAEAGCDLLAGLRCAPPADPSDHPGGDGAADWSFSWRDGDHRVEVDAMRSPTDESLAARLEVRYHPSSTEGPPNLALPARREPRAAGLCEQGRFLRVQLRPEDGLDLTRRLGEEGWATRLYRLRSDLFTAAAFEGSVELAAYEPPEGFLVPPLVLAVPLSDRELAEEGLDTFVREIQETWPVRFATFRFGELEGVCATNLDILPDLAPCAVVREDVLILGWNPPSVFAALGSARAPSPIEARGGTGGLRIHLDLDSLQAVDAAIRSASGIPASAAVPIRYPWSRLDVRGNRRGQEFLFEVELGDDGSR